MYAEKRTNYELLSYLSNRRRGSSKYPWLAEIYEEISEYMHKPEEVLTMFSDALKILDHNTVQYMIEEQAQLLDDQLQKIGEQTEQLDKQKKK